MIRNDLKRTITHALDEMKIEQGEAFSFDKVNLAELERRTGISRAKLRRLKDQGFKFQEHGCKGLKAKKTVLSGYEDTIDKFLTTLLGSHKIWSRRISGQRTCKAILSDY